MYSFSDGESFEKEKTFKIKVFNDFAIIVKDFKIIKESSKAEDKNVAVDGNNKVKCEYCGGTYYETLNSCPHCGSANPEE